MGRCMVKKANPAPQKKSQTVKVSEAKLPPSLYPFKTRSIEPANWYRVHDFVSSTGKYGPADFNDSGRGDARFSPLWDSDENVIPTLYAAQTLNGAICEVVLHDLPVGSTGYLFDWEATRNGPAHISSIWLDSLNLVDLTAIGLTAAGIEAPDLFSTKKVQYKFTRQWARHIYDTVPEAQGLHWMSVRDNTSQVVMIFGNRISSAAIQDLGQSAPIAQCEATVLELLDRFGCGIGGY